VANAGEIIGGSVVAGLAGGLGSYFLLKQKCGGNYPPTETFRGDLCFQGNPGCHCTNLLSQLLGAPYHPDPEWFSTLIGVVLVGIGIAITIFR
jgi:hypothetical protein